MSQANLFALGDPLPPVLSSGVTVESKTASRDAGEQNRRSGVGQSQRERMIAAYDHAGVYGVTDAEMSRELGILRYVVPARRAEIRKTHRLDAVERRDGSAVWVLDCLSFPCFSEAHDERLD